MSKIPGGCVTEGDFPVIKRKATVPERAKMHGVEDAERFKKAGIEPYAGLPLMSQKVEKKFTHFRNFLTTESCAALRNYYEDQGTFAPVTIQGMAPGKEATQASQQVGSHRITCWDPMFGQELGNLLVPFLKERLMTDLDATDWWQHGKHRHWKPVGVTPMVRYMRYEAGGSHFAHYDAAYIPSAEATRRTLLSGVLYLTTNKTGGTAFIKDGQDALSVWDRNHDDWTRPIREDEIIKAVYPEEGSLILFDHRECHSVTQFSGERAGEVRIIIRFDVEFEKTGPF